MKTYGILSLFACALLLAGTARAADEVKTISGEAMCAKCELNLQDKCQTVIQVKEGDKTVSYYVAANAVAKAFHPKVCTSTAQVTATGTVQTVDGKQVLTATSIQLKE
jgi:quinolinate synthase